MSKDKRAKYGSVYVPQNQKQAAKRGSVDDENGGLSRIEKVIAEIQDSMAKSNRDNMDAMQNIDEDNLSAALRRTLRSFDDGITKANTAIQTLADATGAQLDLIAKWQTTTNDNIGKLTSSVATISTQANTNGAYPGSFPRVSVSAADHGS